MYQLKYNLRKRFGAEDVEFPDAGLLLIVIEDVGLEYIFKARN
jgi:hypothetical protein